MKKSNLEKTIEVLHLNKTATKILKVLLKDDLSLPVKGVAELVNIDRTYAYKILTSLFRQRLIISGKNTTNHNVEHYKVNVKYLEMLTKYYEENPIKEREVHNKYHYNNLNDKLNDLLLEIEGLKEQIKGE